MYKPKQAKVISYIWDRKIERQGCLAYLAHDKDVKAEFLFIDSIPVTFKEVFPIDLPSMPSNRDIDLELDTRSIFASPYCIAPTELRELNIYKV